MAMTSPRIESPLNASRNSKTIPSYTSPPRFYSELPLQESVSSASPIPASPRVSSISALLPTPQYIDQIKAVIEQQRQLHEKERALWITETHALQDKVAQLEASLRRYQERNGDSGVIFPLDDRSGTTFGTFGGFPLATASKSTTASTGNEFWRGAGGKSDAVPTRTFSDPTSSRPKPENKQMPSIPEDAISYHPGRALSADTTIAALPRQHPPLNQTIDGIIFKPTTLSLPTTKPALPLDESPSPSHSSPASALRGPLHLRSLTLDPPPDDPYLEDAGHTPRARGTLPSTLDGSLSTTPSPPAAEPDRLPHPSVTSGPEIRSGSEVTRRSEVASGSEVARPPNERSDSYFPVVGEGEGDEDLALVGPLGLTNDGVGDLGFLTEVGVRLRGVERERERAGRAEGDGGGGRDGVGDGNGDADVDVERGVGERGTGEGINGGRGDGIHGEGEFVPEVEVEPRLRMKRSMNFGSEWGAARCGRKV